MTHTERKKMLIRPRRGLLMIAALLLFLPDLHLLDLTPDIIAYLLLFVVFSPYAVLNEHMSEAVRLIEQMLLVHVAQLLSIFFVFGVLSTAENPAEQPMAILLCCFVFAFFKIKIGIPMLQHLKNGLIYLDVWNDGTMFCQKKLSQKEVQRKKYLQRQSYTNITERMLRSCTIFLVVKSALNTLPELAALTYDPYETTRFCMYDFIGLLRGMAMFVVVIWGVCWLVHALRYIGAVTRDHAFYERLSEQYLEEDRLHPERRTQKKLRNAFMLLLLFAVFTIDFSFDNVNIFPDFFGAIMLLIFMRMLSPYLTVRCWHWGIILTYGVVSFGNYVVTSNFFIHYRPESISRSIKIRQEYVPVQILSVVEAVLLLFVMVAVLQMVYEMIDRYTGYEIESTVNYSREEKLKEEHQNLKKNLIPVCVFGILTVISGPLYIFMCPTVEFAWFFSFLIPMVFAVLVSTRLRMLKDCVDNKFMLM